MFEVIHKLTQKPVRSHVTAEILKFETKKKAEKFAEMKNKVMRADFYTVKDAQK